MSGGVVKVRGRCPSCDGEHLFVGSGGYVTCSLIGCADPCAADIDTLVTKLEAAEGMVERLKAAIRIVTQPANAEGIASEVNPHDWGRIPKVPGGTYWRCRRCGTQEAFMPCVADAPSAEAGEPGVTPPALWPPVRVANTSWEPSPTGGADGCDCGHPCKRTIAALCFQLGAAEERIGLARVVLEPRSFVYYSQRERAERFWRRTQDALDFLTDPANAEGSSPDTRRLNEGRLDSPPSTSANAEGIASGGGSAQAANPRDFDTDAPSAEAGAHAVQRDVEAMHRRFGIGVVGEPPALRRPELRAVLLAEEAEETLRAMGYFDATVDLGELEPAGYHDFHGAIDGLCDLLAVIYGAAVEWGINLAPFWGEVHRTNMAKRHDPANPKLVKPEGWQPPDIAGILVQESSAGGAA